MIDWSKKRCGNCEARHSLTVLNNVDSKHERVLTSDSKEIDKTIAYRTICNKCGCMEVHFSPVNALREFFENQYDISDKIQDHIIVKDDQVVSKHDCITRSFFAQLDNAKLPAAGRYLEIACGKGELCINFAQKFPGWKCTGIDPSKSGPQICRDNVRFIRDFFDTKYFENETFDLIVAHGFLNRSKVLPELLNISRLAKKETVLSLDLMILEDSVHAPYIWDHSYMYTNSVIREYLKFAGFDIVADHDCTTARHLTCRYHGNVDAELSDFLIPESLFIETETLFKNSIRWWECVFKKTLHVSKEVPDNYNIALYGAGLHNAILCSKVKELKVDFIIDDLRFGAPFFGVPVKKPEEMNNKNTVVLLCSRPQYIPVLIDNLSSLGLAYTVLHPECQAAP